MELIAPKESNLHWLAETVDSEGNRWCLNSLGMTIIRSDAIDKIDLLAFKFGAEVVCPRYRSKGQEASAEQVNEEIQTFLRERKLSLGDLLKTIAKTEKGEEIKGKITHETHRLINNQRFRPRRDNYKKIVPSFNKLNKEFLTKQLPQHTKAIATQTQLLSEKVKEKITNWAEGLSETRGTEFTEACLRRIRDELDEYVETIKKKKKAYISQVAQYNTNYSGKLVKIESTIKEFNFFRNQDLQKLIALTFSDLTSAWISEVTLVALYQAEQCLCGITDDDAKLVSGGLIHYLEELSTKLQKDVKFWNDIEKDFARQYQARLDSLGKGCFSFEFVVGDPINSIELDEVFHKQLSEPGVLNEAMKDIGDIVASRLALEDLKKQIVQVGRDLFAPRFEDQTVETWYNNGDRSRIDQLEDILLCSDPFLPCKTEVNRRHGINTTENLLTLVAVEDVERSEVKPLMKSRFSLQDDDFGSTGVPDQIIIVKKRYGEPLYAYKYMEAYHKKYQMILSRPNERALSAVEDPERLPEIEEPSVTLQDIAMKYFTVARAMEIIVWDEKKKCFVYLEEVRDEDGRIIQDDAMNLNLGNKDLAISKIIKDRDFRVEKMGRRVEAFLNSDGADDRLVASLEGDGSARICQRQSRKIIRDILKERFGKALSVQ